MKFSIFNFQFSNKSGYIAISTAIVLSLLILVVATTLGAYTFSTRLNIVDFDNKHASYSAARSCLNEALLRLADDLSYAGGETFQIGDQQCSVVSISTVGLNSVIKARSQIRGTTTNLQLTVNSATLSTVSLEEVVKF